MHDSFLTRSCPARSPKLLYVGPWVGPACHLIFTPVLINVLPPDLPSGADVPPILQDIGIGIDPTPGHMVVTPPVDPGAGTRDRAALAEAAAERAASAP